MASINFYSGGKILTGEVVETANTNVYRTQMEGGYSKQAKRSHKSLVNRTVTYVYTAAEYESFKTWFYTTAANGALFFNWVDPVDNVTKDTRIVDGTYEASPASPRMSHWFVSMTFESYR